MLGVELDRDFSRSGADLHDGMEVIDLLGTVVCRFAVDVGGWRSILLRAASGKRSKGDRTGDNHRRK
jgi:hypothetical protein